MFQQQRPFYPNRTRSHQPLPRRAMPFQAPVAPPRRTPIRLPRPPIAGRPAGGQLNNVLANFRKSDGKWDTKKISSSATQMMSYYDQFKKFSPMIMSFLGK
ncbi:YppG family protein [Radiobacillus sp. PE A8.2]|uniref:YppG family protein n=1 Tax=Radiobacillus sp. PE A8.2 TaxID=3380349 RepID=UPI00388F50E5